MKEEKQKRIFTIYITHIVFPFRPSTVSYSSFILQTHPLTSCLFPPFLSTTPASDSSITTLWLPVGSSHSEMYEHGEKWMTNSIKSIIPEAVLCYQRYCKGVLMHCRHAQLPPDSHRNQSCGPRGRETSFTDSSETRAGLFQRGDAQQ